MEAKTKLNESYKIKDNVNVSITIIVGNGQYGKPALVLDGDLVAIGNGTGIDNHNLGPGSALKGKALNVLTSVDDVNPKTNHTSLIYILSGGETFKRIPNSEECEKDGSVDYNDLFNFI